MTAQPTHYWQFNEKEGLITTDKVSGVQGQLNNAIFPKHSRIESAISLGTLTSHVGFGDRVGQFGTDDFTIAFGMMILDERPGRDALDIIGNRFVRGHGNWVSLRTRFGGCLQIEVDEDNRGKNYIRTRTDNFLQTHTWYHVAAVREGTTLRLYVDGVLRAEATSNTGVANINNGADFRLGNHQYGTLGALYQDLRIYNTALDEHKYKR